LYLFNLSVFIDTKARASLHVDIVMNFDIRLAYSTYRVTQKMTHGVYGNNFVYSQSFFKIFGTCTL